MHRVVLDRALAVGDALVAALREDPAAERVELAGSARRMADSVKDLDVIATATEPARLAQAAAALDLVEAAGTPAESRVRLHTHTGLPVDLRIVAPDQFGNLLQHLFALSRSSGAVLLEQRFLGLLPFFRRHVHEVFAALGALAFPLGVVRPRR